MTAPVLPICPKCKQTDQVQKVTSTYGVNTKEWYETRTSTDADGHTHSYQEKHEANTHLGLKLKPPQQPPQPVHPGIWYGVGGFIALILFATLCPIAIIPLSFLIPLAGTASAFARSPGDSYMADLAGRDRTPYPLHTGPWTGRSPLAWLQSETALQQGYGKLQR